MPKDELKRYKEAARFRPLTGIPFLNGRRGERRKEENESFRPLTGIPFLNNYMRENKWTNLKDTFPSPYGDSVP